MFFPIKDYNPTKRIPYITIFLIVVNVLIFSYQNFFSKKPLNHYINHYSMVPYEITHLKNVKILVDRDQFGYPQFQDRNVRPVPSLISSIFMHGSLMHLLGNMLFLWIFGNNIEDYLGMFLFSVFYLVSGIGAGLIHILFNFNSLTPVIGASGAVSGVMGAYLILFPKAKVKTLIFIFFFITFVDIPASAFLVIWFIYQFFYAGGGSIAWLAHIGGFLIGLVLIYFVKKKRPVMEIMEEI
ncbi:MAG: rhomboid family intramembrane serine protease [Acidobacteriota bacterium]